MATARSLGLHEPSGLSYLINESILPPNTSNKSNYNWQTNIVYDARYGEVEEEVLTTSTCVVWSRGGIIKRVFRLDHEGESIIQAVVTEFPVIEPSRSRHLDAPTPISKPRGSLELLSIGQTKKSGKASQNSSTASRGGSAAESGQSDDTFARALVVVLKSQAHIYFLSGDTQVVHMPFEAQSVHPTPRGIIVQRKSSSHLSQKTPVAPPNSFVSSQVLASSWQASRSVDYGGTGNGPLLRVSPMQDAPPTFVPRAGKPPNLPRVFTITDPMSEMGLIVTESGSLVLDPGGRGNSKGYLGLLEPSEKILYVSERDEWPHDRRFRLEKLTLVLVVTYNRQTMAYSIWTAKFRHKDSILPSKRPVLSGLTIMPGRRSSHRFGPGTGAATPVGRGSADPRESFGPNGFDLNHLAGSKNATRSVADEDELASQIGPDFGEPGASLKASRRVSSLLARADLAASNDRATFSEVVSQNAGKQVRISRRISEKRRDSISVQAGRPSMDTCVSHGRRSSVYGESSFLSTGNSLHEAPVDHLLAELNSQDDLESIETGGWQENIGSMPREMVLTRIDTISSPVKDISQPSTGGGHSSKPEVFVLKSSLRFSSEAETLPLSVGIMEKDTKHLIVANLNARSYLVAKHNHQPGRADIDDESRTVAVQAADVRHGSEVVDACMLRDGETHRMLVMTREADGTNKLTLQAPWSILMTVDLPHNFLVNDLYSVAPTNSPLRRREGGLKRVISDMSKNFNALQNPSTAGTVDIVDDEFKRHKIQIQLEPTNKSVKNILNVCNFILRGASQVGESFVVGWCNILKWLRTKPEMALDLEWTAMVVLLFTLAVPFIKDRQTRTPVKQSRRKTGLLRSSSGSVADLGSWEMMLEQEAAAGGTCSSWMSGGGWGWTTDQGGSLQVGQASPPLKTRGVRSSAATLTRLPTTGRKNTYVLRCASLARDFIQSPVGKHASGPQGYIPSLLGSGPSSKESSLPALLIGLHLYREETKLDTTVSEGGQTGAGILAPVLAQIGGWLAWPSWGWKDNSYYQLETSDMDQWLFEDLRMSMVPTMAQPFEPPSIFTFIENRLCRKTNSGFLTLLDLVSNLGGDTNSQMIRSRHLQSQLTDMTPKTASVVNYLMQADGNASAAEKVRLMLACGFTVEMVQTLPEGVSASLYESIAGCQAEPPSSWTKNLLELIDRDDLRMSMYGDRLPPTTVRSQMAPVHDAVRDFHLIGSSTLETDSMSAFDASAEMDRASVTKLIFCQDRRFIEASKITNQMRAPVAQCIPEPDWSEPEVLEAQKELVQLVTVRTFGRDGWTWDDSFRCPRPPSDGKDSYSWLHAELCHETLERYLQC